MFISRYLDMVQWTLQQTTDLCDAKLFSSIEINVNEKYHVALLGHKSIYTSSFRVTQRVAKAESKLYNEDHKIITSSIIRARHYTDAKHTINKQLSVNHIVNSTLNLQLLVSNLFLTADWGQLTKSKHRTIVYVQILIYFSRYIYINLLKPTDYVMHQQV